jgi:hypothetical protein
MSSSGMLRRVALVRTDVSEERSASFVRVTRIGELGTTVAVTSCIPRLCGSVTNNTTRVRTGYRVYSLWRLTAATGYNYNEHYSTVSFSDPADGTALR